MATDRKFVKWSSPDSIAEGKISALAIVEVILSVGAYWWIAITFNTHLHILFSIVAAPLVLLRSKASVEAAKVMWTNVFDSEIDLNTLWGIAILTTSALAAGIAIYFVAKVWTIEQHGSSPLWQSAVLGILASNFTLAGAVVAALKVEAEAPVAGKMALASAGALAGAAPVALAGAGAGAITVTGALAGAGAVAVMRAAAVAMAVQRVLPVERSVAVPASILYLPGLMFGLWLRTLGVRIVSVAENLYSGWGNLPENWLRVMFAEDACHSPEILPGVSETNFGGILRNELNIRDRSSRWLIRAIAVPMWFLPTLLWRYSLKSTVWFYLLILLLTRPGTLKDEDDRKIRIDGPTPWDERAGLLIATATLAIAFIALVDWLKAWELLQTLDGNAPFTVLGWLFVVNWSDFYDEPWKWFSLSAAALTLFLFFWMSRLKSRREGARKNNLDPDEKCPLGKSLYWTDRTKNALVYISLMVGLVYFTKVSYHAGKLDPIAPVLRTIFG